MAKSIWTNKNILRETCSEQSPYTAEEKVSEVAASMAMEGMRLPDRELEMLRIYATGNTSGDELRKRIIKEVRSK